MLSNTADTKPSPSAVCHEAGGSLSTGIMDAHRIRESRKTLPLKAPANRLHSGRRQSAATRMAAHTPTPMNGKASDKWRKCKLTATFTPIAMSRMEATTTTRGQSTVIPAGASFVIGEYRCCRMAAGIPKITMATPAGTNASSTSRGFTPSIHIIVVVVSPTTLPEPPALEAATMAAR